MTACERLKGKKEGNAKDAGIYLRKNNGKKQQRTRPGTREKAEAKKQTGIEGKSL